MPKLTRYLQKIFANNSNQVGVFGTGVDKETSKNVETLQSADYEEGWSSAIITNKNYPIWQEMDGVQYGLSYQLKYLLQSGIPEWLSTETYYTNDYCRVGSTIYYSLQDNNINHNPALQDGYWTPLLTSNRSIGEIIPSITPLTEAGLHLLDGALISNGMYSDFITYMANLTATAPNIFCTEAQWQTSVATYGVCGKFVYDSVNNTVRLPKITGFVEGTDGVATLGDLTEAGLPNLQGWVQGAGVGNNYCDGELFTVKDQIANVRNDASDADNAYNFDASNYNSIYGNSNTVQPQAIKILYYIVIATTTKTDIEVDIDEIDTDLNGKADADGSNMVSSVKNFDGQWVHSQSVLGTSLSVATYTVDVSSYLPNDNYQYEVLLNLRAYSTNSSNAGYIFVYSDIFSKTPTTDPKGQGSAGGYSRQADNTFIIPVGTGRTIYYEIANYALSEFSLLAWGYRRIGTNS